MRNHLVAAATTLLLLPATASAQPSQIPAPVRAAADVIQQSSLKRDVDYLAADALRGRETPSPGLDTAAAYVARRLAAMKLAPARSEERRVGKECRTRWASDHYQKNEINDI